MLENDFSESVAGFRLSPQQRRAWFQALGGEPEDFRVRCTVKVEGAFDRSILERASRALVDRYEILRTRFRKVPGLSVPVQEVLPEALPRGEAGLRLGFRREGGRQLFDVTLPALQGDAPSFEVLLRDLARAYGELGAGRRVSEVEVAQYPDIAEWQNELAESEEAREGLRFWRDETLLDCTACHLPLARPAEGPFAPAAVELRLEGEGLRRLEEGAEGLEVDLESLLEATWHALLQRLGWPRSTVAVAFDGRNYEDLEGSLGPLTRFLPITGGAEPGTRFRELARGIAEARRDGALWQEFGVLGLASGAEGREKEEIFLPAAFEAGRFEAIVPAQGCRWTVEGFDQCLERFQLKLSAWRFPDSLSLCVHFDGSRFDEISAGEVLNRFSALLASALEDPDGAVEGLDLLGAAGRTEVLSRSGGGTLDFPRQAGPAELFEAQAARRPQAVAVVQGERSWTYAELNRRANRLAHALAARGVGRGAVVGILLERSMDLIAAKLGTWKAGAAYVALEVDHPASRNQELSKGAGVEVLLSSSSRAGELRAAGLDCLCVDRDGELDGFSSENPGRRGAPEDLAYVVFTSGSTGRPKGVMTRRSSVVSYLTAARARYRLEPGDVALQLAAPSFDASTRDTFAPLLAGARLVLLEEGEARAPVSVAARLRDSGTTVLLSVVPTVLRALTAAAEKAGGGSDLRLIVVSGEVLRGADCRRARQAFGGELRILNQYGPTECTMTSTFGPVAPDAAEGPVSLGRPMPNARTYVVDAGLAPSAMGVDGELLIGGEGVARGYLGDPSQTAERFVPDPFGDAGGRLYRTGDRGRWRPDGQLEFLGRRDAQVKVRGIRVELAEVERCLADHEAVRDAVVSLRPEGGEEGRLVGYFRALGEAPPAVGELRDFLARTLPEALIPSAFVVVDEWPLTVSGKVDRNALPGPNGGRPRLRSEFVAPRSAAERQLAAIWEEVLGVEEIGIEDDFFELGGHSLLATRLLARLSETFEADLPLRTLFDAPTVAQLSLAVEGAAGRRQKTDPVVPVPRDGEVALALTQERIWFLDQLTPDLHQNVPAIVRLRGPLDPEHLERAMAEIVRRHEVLRMTFADGDGRPVPRIHSPEAAVPQMETLDLSQRGRSEGEVRSELRSTVVAWLEEPIDASRAPLIRVQHIRLGPEDRVLVVAIHHIVGDGESMAILFKELGELLTAYREERPPRLPDLPVQFADYAAWQRRTLTPPRIEELTGYWRDRLAGAPSAWQRLAAGASPAPSEKGNVSRWFHLAPELSRDLRRLARGCSATPFMIFLAAFQASLSWLTRLEDLTVGSYCAGRERREVEGLIGCFAGFLPLRVDLSGDPSFAELVARVREATLEGLAHQSLPYEELERRLGAAVDLEAPKRVVFDYDESLEHLAVEGLEFSNLEMGAEALANARSGLLLNIFESPVAFEGRLVYPAAVGEASQIDRIPEALETLLSRAVAEPAASLSRLLGALTEGEEEKLEVASLAKLKRIRRRPAAGAGS